MNESRRGPRRGLPISGNSPVATKPRERSFDYPSPRKNLEPTLLRWFPDYLHRDVVSCLRPVDELALVASVTPNTSQPWRVSHSLIQKAWRCGGVLDVGWGDNDPEQESFGVNNDVSLATVNLLSRVIADRPAAWSRRHALAIDDAGAWREFTTHFRAEYRSYNVRQLLPNAIICPGSEASVDRLPGRKRFGQESPSDAATEDVSDCVIHLSIAVDTRTATGSLAPQDRTDQCPSSIVDIRRVADLGWNGV